MAMYGTKRPGKPVEILLIDDSDDDAHLMKKALERTGRPHHLTTVMSGDEAFDHLCRTGAGVRPDLILLDLNMPRMNGHEVLATIKRDPALLTIPVIVVTTSDAEEDIRRSYELHASGYVLKTPELSDFFEAVRSLVDFWLGAVKLPPRTNHERNDDSCACC